MYWCAWKRRMIAVLVIAISGYCLLYYICADKLLKLNEQPEKVNNLGTTWRQKRSGPGCAALHFSARRLPLTALASYPGSGNTWVRHLLQQATGVFTGSIYKDRTLKRHGFPGEGINNRSCVAIKSHSSNWNHICAFNRVVLIMRDPAASILSEFNRRQAGHLGRAHPDEFVYGKGWSDFVQHEGAQWLHFYKEWLQFPGPLYLLRYDDLMKDLRKSVLGLTNFLGFEISLHQMNCVLSNAEGRYHRQKPVIDQQGEFFTDEMNAKLTKLQNQFESMVSEMRDSR